jgi:hypothetical protein
MTDPAADTIGEPTAPAARSAGRRRRIVVRLLLAAVIFLAMAVALWWMGGDDAGERPLNPPGRAASGSGQPAGQTFPLGVGSRWEYAVEYTTLISGPHQASAVAEIRPAEKLGGHWYRRLVTTAQGVPGGGEDVKYLCRRDDGIYRILPEHLELGEALLIPSRPAVGQSWQMPTGGPTATFRIVGREEVPVPAGRFDCWKVEITGQFGPIRFQDTLWVANGVGIVQQIQQRLGLTVVSKLTDYKLADEDEPEHAATATTDPPKTHEPRKP